MKLTAFSLFSPRQSGTRPNTSASEGHSPSRPSSTPVQDRFSSSFTPSGPNRNPHLANPVDTLTLRPQITQQAQSNPSFYGTLVSMVNNGLQQAGIGISPASHQSVMNNLQQVHQGNMSQGTAHFTEAISFAQDAVNSFSHGRPLQGMVETSGVVLNTVGGLGMSFLQGLGSTSQGATPPELNGTSDW
ncbi:MAG TPA: hypothetical protein VNA24_19280 [Hyalangium sp.]|jgi:hypothetical protein|nr:hypothetical protein [Hyalangium sp.]